MVTDTRADELRDAEHRLQAAQLAADVTALDQLLDDRLIFTHPDGRCYSKQDDLRVHRSRQQVLTQVREEDLTVIVDGRTGVTWFLGTVEGTFAGAPFAARCGTPERGFMIPTRAGVFWPLTPALSDRNRRCDDGYWSKFTLTI